MKKLIYLSICSSLLSFNSFLYAEDGGYAVGENRQGYCDYKYGPSAMAPEHVYRMVVHGAEVAGSKRAAADGMLETLDQAHEKGSVGYDIYTALYNAAADGATLEELSRLAVRMCMNSNLNPETYDSVAP